MKIVEIIPALYPIGGAETFFASLSEMLAQNSTNEIYCISLYAKQKGDYLSEKLKQKGASIIYLNKHRGIDFKCAKNLKKELNKIKPDIIHSHLKGSVLTIWLAKRKLSTPWVYTFHTTVSKKMYGSKFNLVNLLIKLLIQSKRIIPVGISDKVSSSIEKFFKCKKVETIKNGVDVSRFNCEGPLEERNIDFLFIGRFVELKHPLEIIQAFKITNDKYGDKLRLVMVGSGRLKPQCENYVQSHGLKNIQILNETKKPEDFFEKAKFFVLSSSIEGNPMVINEALASGCYIISTNVGGISDVTSRSNSLLFDYCDRSLVNDLAEAMQCAYRNREMILPVCYAQIENTRSKVSMKRTIDQYQDLFNKICTIN